MTANSLDQLVREVATYGRASQWKGEPVVSRAATAVLGRDGIGPISPGSDLGRLALASLSAWYSAEIDLDEQWLEACPAPEFDLGLLTWSLNLDNTTKQQVAERLVTISRSPATLPLAASFATFLLRSFDRQRAAALFTELRPRIDTANSGALPTPNESTPPSISPYAPVDPASLTVAKVKELALRGPAARISYSNGGGHNLFDILGESLTQPQVFVEFGYESLWRSGHGDLLASVLTSSLRWALVVEQGLEPDPLDVPRAFTPGEDVFFRSILSSRLNRIALGRRQMTAWNFFTTTLLIPFSQIVRHSTKSPETRAVASRVLAVCTRLDERSTAERSESAALRAGVTTKRERFLRLLFTVGGSSLAVLGALFALGVSRLPGTLAGLLSAIGIYVAFRVVHWARRRSGFVWWVLPARDRLLAAPVLAAAWFGAIFATFAVLGELRDLDAVSYAGFAFTAVTLTVAISRFLSSRSRPRLHLSDLIPDVAGEFLPLPPELELGLDVAQWTKENATR